MLNKEVIQRIQSLYSKGVQSDDTRLSSRHIYNKMLTVRSTLISQEAKKNQRVNQWNYQTIPCIAMIEVPIHECPCVPPMGCYILRSKFKLPKPLTNLDSHLIQSVTNLDGDTIYDETSWETKKYHAHNKYTGKKPDYFIRGGYIYITTRRRPELITITGLFEDPVEVTNFASYCCNQVQTTCTSYPDMEFPIDADMIDVLVQLAKDELVDEFNKNRQDLTNNTQDDNPTESK